MKKIIMLWAMLGGVQLDAAAPKKPSPKKPSAPKKPAAPKEPARKPPQAPKPTMPTSAPWAEQDKELEHVWDGIQALLTQYASSAIAGAHIWDSFADADWKKKESLISTEKPGTGRAWELDKTGEFGELLVAYMKDFTNLSSAHRQMLVEVFSMIVPSLYGHGKPIEKNILAQAIASIESIAQNSLPLLQVKLSERFAAKKPGKQGEHKKTAEELAREREEIRRAMEEYERSRQWDVPTTEEYDAHTTIRYLDVLEQQSADCGFHSVKNMWLLLKWLYKEPVLDKIQTNDDLKKNLKSADPKIFDIKKLKACVSAVTNIPTEDIYKLAAEQYPVDRDRFALIPDVISGKTNLMSNNPKPRFGVIEIDKNLGKAVELLRKPNNVFGFILGNNDIERELATGKTKVKPAHYIMAVVKRGADGVTRDVYVANSLHNRAVHDDRVMVKALLEILDNANPKALSAAGSPTT